MSSREPIKIPRIATSRLVLRELEEDDLAEMTWIAGDFEVSKWLVSVPHPYTLEDATTFHDEVKQGKHSLVWAIEYEGEFVGLIGAGPQLGYWLCPTKWGQGLVSEAVSPVINAYFENTDAPELASGYFEGNTGSARILEKYGFIDIGEGDFHCVSRNEDVHMYLMMLTREQWLSDKS